MGTVATKPLWTGLVSAREQIYSRYLPNSKSGEGAAGQEHADALRGGLDGGPNRNGDAHHLHEADPPEFVCDGSLHQSSDSFAGNVNRDNLQKNLLDGVVSHGALARRTYSASQAFIRLAHIINPTLVGDCWRPLC